MQTLITEHIIDTSILRLYKTEPNPIPELSEDATEEEKEAHKNTIHFTSPTKYTIVEECPCPLPHEIIIEEHELEEWCEKNIEQEQLKEFIQKILDIQL